MQHIKPIRVFISYAHADEKLYNKLEEHLSILTGKNEITIWKDQEILVGTNREEQMNKHLNKADIILLLMSASFIALKNKEIQTALEQDQAGTAQVIPILLKPVEWQHSPLSHLEALPRNGRPVTRWHNRDAAFVNVVRDIRSAVEELQMRRRDAGYIIGVDIDRSHLALLLTDRAITTPKKYFASFNTRDGAEVCLTRVADELQALLERNNVTWEQIVGIGLATPGPLDRDLRQMHPPPETDPSASLMPGWEGIDIPSYLRDTLKKEIPIYLDNDANMGALGEKRYGAGKKFADLVYVKIGIGIGAGLIINKHLYRGSTNAAGEFGHSKVVNNKKAKKCDCGLIGCLETVAAEPAIIKDACKGTSLRARNPKSNQTPALEGREETADIKDVIQAALNGDEASKAALESAAKRIGTALGTLINLLNPPLILLDGDVVRGYHDFIKSIRKWAAQSSLHVSWAGVQIETKTCELDFPVAYGAAANVIDSIWGEAE